MDRDISFGSIVKQHRQALDLTQAELARRVACATITIRKIEYDALRPSIQIAERLATSLKIPLEERAAFVRLARTASLKTPTPQPLPTPPPAPEEIGLEDLSGRAIRGFELGDRMGEGGFGVVYRAIQPLVEREVAVKIILPRYADHPEFIRRFEAEAQLVARLEHPYIVPLYDYWREPGAAFLVMRLMRGGSLHSRIKDGALSLDFILRLLNQVGGALFTAHRMGVIHRDLKPANILLDEDENTYLADFGVAKNLGNPEQTSDTMLAGIIGSPAYVSPEQIRAEAIRPQADIYALGILLFQLLTGQQPFQGPTPIDYVQQHLNQPTPPLLEYNPNLPPDLEPVLSRATAKSFEERYPDIPSLVSDFQSAVTSAGVGSVSLEWLPEDQVAIEALENPYKGLRAFEEADSEDFFGRETLVQDLLGRMSEENDLSRFMAVVGPSGSGKSSAVKAGLIPSLRRGGLPNSENWFIVEFTPGSHPFEELETALLRVAVNPPESLLGQLRQDERGLLRSVGRILPEDRLVDLVLVVDQFEELFTLVEDEETRAAFLESLVTALLDERSRLRVVITLRADFTDRPLEYVDFGELLRQRTEFVLPLTPDELEQAITQPTRQAGLALEPGLSERIIRDLGDQPGTLPLLQYALTELFERREGRRLTLQAYQESGGVLGALGKRAEEIYTGLDSEGQETARQVFLRLVTLGEGVEDTRRRVLQAELEALTSRSESGTGSHSPLPQVGEGTDLPRELSAGEVRTILDSFGGARLLSFDHDPLTRGSTVEVAHEALLREWPRLREWLDQSRADIRNQRMLGNAAAEWLEADRDPSFLLRGSRLDQFAAWAETTDLMLTQNEQEYLENCLEERFAREAAEAKRIAREAALERRSRNFLRGLVAVLAVAAVIAVVLSIFAFNQQGIAQENALQADQNAATALAEADARATQQAIAEEQRAIAEEQATLAQEKADLAIGRELALQAFLQLENDAERSILLALTSLQTAYTPEGEEMLHAALQSSRTLLTIPALGGNYSSFAYSPDGSRLAASSDEYSAIVWDAATGQELFRVPDLGDGTRLTNAVFGIGSEEIAFSPDGALLAVGEDDGSLWVLDAASGETLMNLVGHSSWYNALEFSPDGTRIATANHDNTIRMWDAGVGELLYTLDIPAGDFWRGNYLQFSRDGEYLVTADAPGVFRIVEAATGQEVAGFSRARGARHFQFSPDGSLLAIVPGEGEEPVVEFWNFNRLLEGKADEPDFTLTTTNNASIIDVAFSPDGSLLATSNQDGTVKVWSFSPEGVEELFTLAGIHTIEPRIAFSPDGRTLATRNAGAIQTWDVTPGGAKELLTLTGHTGQVPRLVYSPDGALLATADAEDGTVRIWDSETGALLQTLSPIENAGNLFRVAFNPEGTRLAAAGADNLIWVWDVETWQLLLTLSGHEVVENYRRNGVWDITYSPDGSVLASTGEDGTARLWDAQTGELLKTFPIHPTRHGGLSLAFSPDGALLATSSDVTGPVQEDNSIGLVNIWDLTSYQELLRIPRTRFPFVLAFSPDGTQLVTAGAGHTLDFYDTSTGEELFSLSGHTGLVLNAVFSPDGSRLYSTGFDLPKVWDLASRQELYTLSGHTGTVPGINLSPDGTRLATSGVDGTARVYVMDIDKLIALALERVTRWFTPAECLEYLHTETCPPDPRP